MTQLDLWAFTGMVSSPPLSSLQEESCNPGVKETLRGDLTGLALSFRSLSAWSNTFVTFLSLVRG